MAGPPTDRLVESLGAQAVGGRVAFSDFLEPAEADAVIAGLRRTGVRASAWGGYPGARRRVVCALPESVPEATPVLSAVYAEGAVEPEELWSATVRIVGQGKVGDSVTHEAGASVVVLGDVPQELSDLARVGGAPVRITVGKVEHAFGGNLKRQSAVVPSLRVDVLGARAFGVSRAYFQKGVAAGRVSVNGRPAGKSTDALAGDEVFADGLGRFKVLTVDGETRRGNLKVTLSVERS